MTAPAHPIHVGLPIRGLAVDEMVDVACAAIGAGYHGAFAGEINGPDAFTLLGAIASRRPDAHVGTAIASASTRPAWLLAASALSLSHLTSGGVSLGLGTSSAMIREQWSGVELASPWNHLRETVPLVRTLLDEPRTTHHGPHQTVSGFPRPMASGSPIDVLVASLCRTGRPPTLDGAAGVILNQAPLSHVAAIARRAAEMQATGELREDFRLVLKIIGSVEDTHETRDQLRASLRPYFLSGAYRRLYAALGHADVVAAAEAAQDGDAFRRAVTDDFLDDIFAIGDPSHVRSRVEAACACGVDEVVLDPRGPDRASIEAFLAAAR